MLPKLLNVVHPANHNLSILMYRSGYEGNEEIVTKEDEGKTIYSGTVFVLPKGSSVTIDTKKLYGPQTYIVTYDQTKATGEPKVPPIVITEGTNPRSLEAIESLLENIIKFLEDNDFSDELRVAFMQQVINPHLHELEIHARHELMLQLRVTPLLLSRFGSLEQKLRFKQLEN